VLAPHCDPQFAADHDDTAQRGRKP